MSRTFRTLRTSCTALAVRVALVVCAAGAPLHAQRAGVRVTVVDSAGARVPGAALRHLALGRDARDSAGVLVLDSLAGGLQALAIAAHGFRALETDVEIADGVVVALRVMLTALPADERARADSARAADSLARTAAARAVPTARGGVRGRVRFADGSPAPGSEVSLLPAGSVVRADSLGVFALGDVDPGAYALRVRRVGLRQRMVPVRIDATTDSVADVVVEALGQALGTVTVRAAADRKLAGFLERRRRGIGYFVDREEIERRNFPPIASLVRDRPGITVTRRNGRDVIGSIRSCDELGLVIDGVAVRTATGGGFGGYTGIEDLVQSPEIAAIEVYPSASQVPAELMSGNRPLCGVIAIWTR